VLQPTSQQNRVPAPGSSSGTASDTGQQEYQQAEQILRNRRSEAELAVAVRLLWAAVEKGNAGGEVALAELYRQGKGVARNCDQARVLLTAAARRGSAEAQKHLEKFMREGCE
jgi:TPR repeat protein